jgi:hypothetical protein
MSIDLDREPPPVGYLLDELGYLDEPEAAAALGITPQTMTEYRKRGIGPPYAEIARKIIYGRTGIAEWLAAGGTRGAK